MEYFFVNRALTSAPMAIQSTAGAIPMKNDKGELSMKKVKVKRYVTGKRPEYAPSESSDDEDSDYDNFLMENQTKIHTNDTKEYESSLVNTNIQDQDDPRLRRLIGLKKDDGEETSVRYRRIHQPELLQESEHDEQPEKIVFDKSISSEDEDLSDSEIKRRRDTLKTRLLANKNQVQEIMMQSDEDEIKMNDENSEYEEYSASEGEETRLMLKPVFVRSTDRVTVKSAEQMIAEQREAQLEKKKMAEKRKRQTLQMVEAVIRRETFSNHDEAKIDDVVTDDEDGDVAFECWKLRELKRLMRDRVEREKAEAERLEIQRIRNLTNEERTVEEKFKPKRITNQIIKGKYKYLQRYFHRGAFYLDKEDELFKRDFAEATPRDNIDKSILPKVMQVKNFGRCGQSKYTHLLDQDTSDQKLIELRKVSNLKLSQVKQVFERPSLGKLRSTKGV